MTQFTGEDAYVLLADRYIDVVVERAELRAERDHLQEQLDALEKLDALEDQDDEEPEDYVSSKDFYALSNRYEKLENMLRAERETYDDLYRRYYSNLTKVAGDELTRLKSELAKTTEELGKTLGNNAHLNSQLIEETSKSNKLASENVDLKATIAALRKVHPESTEAKFFQYHYNQALVEIGDLKTTIEDLRKDSQKLTASDIASLKDYQKKWGW